MKLRAPVCLTSGLCLLLTIRIASAVDATFVGTNGNWSDPLNWSTNPDLPGTNDNVTVGSSAGLVTLDGQFTITSLSLSTDLQADPDANVDSLTVAGNTVLGSSVLTGNGSDFLAVTGGAFAQIGSGVTLDGFTLRLHSPLARLEADVTLLNGGTIHNQGEFRVRSTHDLLGFEGFLINDGHLYQTVSANTDVQARFTQSSAGTLEVNWVLQLLNDTDISGAVQISPNGTLHFDGGTSGTAAVHSVGAAITGSGVMRIAGTGVIPPVADFIGTFSRTGGVFEINGAAVTATVTPDSYLGDTVKMVGVNASPRFKLAANEPLPPDDKVIFQYHHFNNAQSTANSGPTFVAPTLLGTPGQQFGFEVLFDELTQGAFRIPLRAEDESGEPTDSIQLVIGSWNAGPGAWLAGGVFHIQELNTASGFSQFDLTNTRLVADGAIHGETPVWNFGSQAGVFGDTNSSLQIKDGTFHFATTPLGDLPSTFDIPTSILGGSFDFAAGAQVDFNEVEALRDVILQLDEETRVSYGFPDASHLQAVSNAVISLKNSFFNLAMLGNSFRAGGDGQFELTEFFLEIIGEEPAFKAGLRSSPGQSPGTLTFEGNVALLPGSLQTIELGGPVAGMEHDQLVFSNSLTLDGALEIAFLNGFEAVVEPTDTFTIIAAGSAIAGGFTETANGARLSTADGKGSFVVNYGTGSAYDPASVVLSDFAPAGSQAVLATPRFEEGTGFQFTLQGSPGSNYVVEATEDFLQWTPVATNALPPDGRWMVEDSDATGLGHRFYRAYRP